MIVGAQRLSLAKVLKAAGHCRGRSWRQVSLTEVGQAIKCSCSFPNGEPNCENRQPLALIAVSVACFSQACTRYQEHACFQEADNEHKKVVIVSPGAKPLLSSSSARSSVPAITWAARWKASFVSSACSLNRRTASALRRFGGSTLIGAVRLCRPGVCSRSRDSLKASNDDGRLQETVTAVMRWRGRHRPLTVKTFTVSEPCL